MEPTQEQLMAIEAYKARQRKAARYEAQQQEEQENIKQGLQRYENFRTAELQQRKNQPTDAEQFAMWDAARKAESGKQIARFVLFIFVMTLCVLGGLSSSGLVVFF